MRLRFLIITLIFIKSLKKAFSYIMVEIVSQGALHEPEGVDLAIDLVHRNSHW